MKLLRTLILVLLSVLLPIRGTVAAAMLCPGEAPTIGTAAPLGPGPHGMHTGHNMDVHAAGAHDHEKAAAPDASSSPGQATACPFCASGCCVTPLAFAPPSVDKPSLAAATVFPALTARVTVFYPDGLDRPPRTR